MKKMIHISKLANKIRNEGTVNVIEPTNVVVFNSVESDDNFEDMVNSLSSKQHSTNDISVIYSVLRDSGYIDKYLRLFFVKIDPLNPGRHIIDYNFANRVNIISSFCRFFYEDEKKIERTQILDEIDLYIDRIEIIILLRSFCEGIKEKDNERYFDFDMVLGELTMVLEIIYDKYNDNMKEETIKNNKNNLIVQC